MNSLRLYDTMAREKRVFTPADPARITMYVCGPTVYNRAHIGNARPAVIFDVLARFLRHLHGEDSLVYARNVTDVDDKIIEAARAAGIDPSAIALRFEQYYLDDMGALGVQPPTLAPRATENIEAMIAMIGRLLVRGNAYEADGHVLFHVPSDPDYGALGRRDREAMIAGARVETASYKKDPADFVLWKPSPSGMIGWDSPWGRGRPGWHIECSAMIEAHLGETIDLHGGGLDLIFPHHENEIAQSRCAHRGAPLARYWLHNGFLAMAGTEKMSKSLGNVVTVADLLDAGHKGETLRFALLSAHYRQPLEWSSQLIAQSKATLDRLYRVTGDAEAGEIDAGVAEALADDLNTPLALSRLSAIEDAHCLRASAALLGLLQAGTAGWFQGQGDARIDALVAARIEAKKRRDFDTADRIRDALAAEGVVLEDGAAGTSWRRA
ncbi:cysteine--tRNA ligase [Sphingosinicella rhizophila]|uniref:Cysteine--tRNA ligase n=1 Tax=Sphingosinicella rhizophila TaxID=3050082 RepID=A0ABU3Q371_9SPHN|nr:cysteine--tRNA ligase [Sphingosinicella sp. GR2756]MDT9597861.1 cysteine--tRNA ligase [Sphingosinicella sp. GR2756]